MSDINKLFHKLAEEGLRKPPADDIERLRLLDEKIERRKQAGWRELQIQIQRDVLVARIADILGIRRNEFPEFFNYVDPSKGDELQTP